MSLRYCVGFPFPNLALRNIHINQYIIQSNRMSTFMEFIDAIMEKMLQYILQ